MSKRGVIAVRWCWLVSTFSEIEEEIMNKFKFVFELAAQLDRAGITATRVGLVIVLVWIGGLKLYRYEDEGIVPFVANSPLMSFFYHQPAGEYRQHMNKEGQLIPANREWHEQNGTYVFAYGLGSVIVLLGVLISLHPWFPRVSAVGSFLVVGMSFVTLSFLITTPECWVPALGSSEHGFPLLSGAGRLVVKDVIMLGAALVTMADSAKAYLRRSQELSRSFTQDRSETFTRTNQNSRTSLTMSSVD
ncbi:MAG: ykgB [Planctomycetaceae bacterium]|nr:ykgB [Planctomycetaceae bacterium]